MDPHVSVSDGQRDHTIRARLPVRCIARPVENTQLRTTLAARLFVLSIIPVAAEAPLRPKSEAGNRGGKY